MLARQRIAFVCVALLGVGAFSMLTRTAGSPAAATIDPAVPDAIEVRPDTGAPAPLLTGSPGAAILPIGRAVARIEKTLPPDLSEEAQVERRWLLSFPIEGDLFPPMQGLSLERPDQAQHTARFHPESGLFRVDLVGTQAELREMELAVSSGRGMTAKVAIIQLEEDDAPPAIGTLSLKSAAWDHDRATIQAGPLRLERPAILGTLILEPAGLGGASFFVTALGPNGPTRVRVDFSEWEDESSAMLVTFLPLTEWTAKVIDGPAMASLPDWEETAPAGRDIVVPLSDTGGVQISVNARHVTRNTRVVLVQLPSPRLTSMSRKALGKRTLDQGTPSIKLGGTIGRYVQASGALIGKRHQLVAAGHYMVEVWDEDDETGEMVLVVDQPVVVHDRMVKVQID